MTIDELRCALRGVAAYRHIVDAPLMGLTLELLDRLASGDGTGAVERYARLFYELRQADCSGLGMWLHDQLRYQESPYARLVERGGEDPALEEAARRDVETFTLLSELDCDAVLRENAGAPGIFPCAGQSAPVARRMPLYLSGAYGVLSGQRGGRFRPLPRLSMGGWGSAAGGAARLPRTRRDDRL